MLDPKGLKHTRKEAVDNLWFKGVLYWKLNSAQKKIYEMFYNTKSRSPVIQCSRRGGKSFTLIILALEQAIRQKNSMIHYACATATMATKIVIPTMNKILDDCPQDLKPSYHKADKAFLFPNGSKIQIEGVDEGNAERLRGTSTNLGIIDEAGFVDDLESLINDIFLPQTLTTNGKLILSSTPPKSSGHAFTKFIEKAKLKDAYIKLTMPDIIALIANDPIHLRSHLDPDILAEIKESIGGENSPTWRREFLVENLTDSSSAVLPEFTDALEKEIVKIVPRPQHYHYYTAMDPGMTDFTGILFAYLDFKNAKLVIEDEYLGNSADKITIEHIADVIKVKEGTLWKNNESERGKLAYRVSDNDAFVINELAQKYKINFIISDKREKEVAISDVRVKLNQLKIVINPRCKNLIYQMKTVIWNKSRKTFQRGIEDAGHFDLVDALIYLVKVCQWNRNPYPGFVNNNEVSHYSNKNSNLSQTAQAFKGIFVKSKTKKT